MQVKHGTTRTVILVYNYAFKFPIVKCGWKNFLLGLIANMQEVTFSKMNDDRMMPVLFKLPLGLLVVMPRARMLTEQEWFNDLNWDYFYPEEGMKVPCEDKRDSVGYYKGRIVAIDYGN